jgi:hypothetical protein
MSVRNEKIKLADLQEAGLDPSDLARVHEKNAALHGIAKAQELLKEEVEQAVALQRHILTAPEGQLFVVERQKFFTKPTNPAIETGHYPYGSRNDTELVASFPIQTIAAQDAKPFTADRIEVSLAGYMAVGMGDEGDEVYRLVDFAFDRVRAVPTHLALG